MGSLGAKVSVADVKARGHPCKAYNGSIIRGHSRRGPDGSEWVLVADSGLYLPTTTLGAAICRRVEEQCHSSPTGIAVKHSKIPRSDAHGRVLRENLQGISA